MATSEIEVSIVRGSQRQDSYRVTADPSSPGALRDVLIDWLDAQRVPADLRPKYVLTTFTHRLIEVHA